MRRFEHPSLGTVEAWNDVDHDATTGIVTYQTHYRIIANDRHYSAASKIQFTTQERLAVLLDEAGLVIEKWLGDWKGRHLRTDIARDYSGRWARVAPSAVTTPTFPT